MTKATPESSDSLVFECDFAEPPEKVWRALTEPRLLAAWLTADPAETDSAKRPVPYEIVSADPHRLLRYRWRDRESGAAESSEHEVQSLVTVELAPGPDGGTHLRLTHADFRIVPTVASVPAADVTPITSARRCKTPTMSFTAPRSLRRAA
ncbi:MAG: SRPBCC family protein [Steroidobacteraceae bacterium]